MKIRITIIALLAVGLPACSPQRFDVRAVRYAIDARVDPGAHTLDASTTVELTPVTPPYPEKATIELQLHPRLVVEHVEVEGAKLRGRSERKSRQTDGDRVRPATHRLTLDAPTDGLQITLRYAGELHQDVAAGEEEGQIHNFAVSAHVGEEGLYLEPAGYWYPQPPEVAGSPADQALADYELRVDPIEGFELVAGLESESAASDGRLRWQSPFPLDGLVLLGGPLERFSRTYRGVERDIALHTVLAPGKEKVAADILDAAAEYLDRYEPLVGPYPFSEFTVLEAFFSSGFAFPACTQIAGSQLSEYRQYRRHGYLDHELLHNWWGNGLLVDPGDGNWCEGLASYMGNYYGFVLDGDAAGARKQRRNQSNFLSSIEPEDDRPLGSFGLKDGAGRGIGYSKGAAVFHMLERRIGTEAMFEGLRKLTAEQMGQHVSWAELQAAWQSASGEDLNPFFEQWVRDSGAPQLELAGADWVTGADRVEVTIDQHGTDFVVDVPLRLFYPQNHEDVTVRVVGASTTVTVPVSGALQAIELDPDFHVFRRLKTEEIMPTSAITRRATRLLAVVPSGELSEGYGVLRDAYERDVLGDEDDPTPDAEFALREPGGVADADLAASAVLVLGDAVSDPAVAAFLERAELPVTFGAGGFSVEGERYDDDRHAVFVTVHHPDLAGQGVTVYYGNSANALANARVLSFYPNSLLVFEAPEEAPEGAEGAADGAHTGMPRTEVIRRMDFESHDRIEM